jgi:hypothetical protein
MSRSSKCEMGPKRNKTKEKVFTETGLERRTDLK